MEVEEVEEGSVVHDESGPSRGVRGIREKARGGKELDESRKG